MQWQGCSKMCSGQMEALIRLYGDAVEVQVKLLLNYIQVNLKANFVF